MEIKLAQRLSLGLNIVMTPQLQQAIRLLQLSRIELIDEVRRELEANPVLADDDSDPRERNDVGGPGDYVGRSSDQAMSDLDNHAADRDINARREEKKAQEVDWEQFLENRTLQQPTYATRSGFEELPPIEQSLTRATSLADHLRWQLQMSEFTEAEKAFVELVISNLDDNGFLDLEGSYHDEAEELTREVERSPASKFAVFNLGVLQEKMGNHEAARVHFVRFLGDDCGEEERAIVELVLRMVRRCDDGFEELIRDLVALPDSQPWARELLPRFKAKDAQLRDLREIAGQVQRQAPRLGDGGKRLQSLIDAMDGLLHLRAPPMAEPLDTLFRKALHLALDASFSEAAAILERIPGLDVGPRERERVKKYLERLAEGPGVVELAPPRSDEIEEEDPQPPGARLTIEQMAERAGLDPEDALEVLRLVQNFDPVGVASRDLRECLRVQAEAFSYDELELAIIERHIGNDKKPGNLEKHKRQVVRPLHRPAAEDHREGHPVHRREAARLLREGHRAPQADDPPRRRRGRRDAREHHLPRHHQQVRPHPARDLRAQVLLQQLHPPMADEDIASESVKQAIKKIIARRTRETPSPTSRSSSSWRSQKVLIARRTVAKYREMLGILQINHEHGASIARKRGAESAGWGLRRRPCREHRAARRHPRTKADRAPPPRAP
jgi:DNA-directed RNA polymerase specialized sigma54-like protein